MEKNKIQDNFNLHRKRDDQIQNQDDTDIGNLTAIKTAITKMLQQQYYSLVESLCCTPETNVNTVYQLYIKFLKSI